MPEPILHRIAAGESDAVQECVDRYGGLVHSLARRFCPAGEVEDAVQEVFVDLWRKAGRYDPTLSAEVTFVTMIARRRLIDHGRRRKEVAGSALVDDELPAKLSAAEHERVEICDEADRAAKALARLKPDQQRVLKLAIYDGLSHEAIAEATNLPLGTVKTHVRRGLIRVREMLGVVSSPGAGGARP